MIFQPSPSTFIEKSFSNKFNIKFSFIEYCGISIHCILDLSNRIAIDRGNKEIDMKKGQTLAMSSPKEYLFS